jgi:hypothetical protein
MASSHISSSIRRQSRRGNPESHPSGLLHFVRNDGKGVMNLESINKWLDVFPR